MKQGGEVTADQVGLDDATIEKLRSKGFTKVALGDNRRTRRTKKVLEKREKRALRNREGRR